MKRALQKHVAFAITFAVCVVGSVSTGFAAEKTVKEFLKKPVVKQAAVGAAIGTAGGVLSERTSVGKGAFAGALTGAGTGLVSQSKYLEDKPLLRNTAKGAIVGTGASYALGNDKVKGAALGAGGGAGYHFIRQYLDKR